LLLLLGHRLGIGAIRAIAIFVTDAVSVIIRDSQGQPATLDPADDLGIIRLDVAPPLGCSS